MNLLLEEFFEAAANPSLRGHSVKIRHQLPHLTHRKFAFPVRIVEPCNTLPPEVVDAASEEILKIRLDGAWNTLRVP